jgi:PAS domain S-box-containing protein
MVEHDRWDELEVAERRLIDVASGDSEGLREALSGATRALRRALERNRDLERQLRAQRVGLDGPEGVAKADVASDASAVSGPNGLIQSVLDSMAEGVVVADREGQLLYFNAAAVRILGEGVLNVPPERWPAVYGLYRADRGALHELDDLPLWRAIRGEEVHAYELRQRRPGDTDGRLLSITARPVRDDAGQVSGAVAVFRDVTQRRRTEEALKRERDFADGLIDTAPVIALLLDPEGRIVRFNRYMEELSGYRLDEIEGRDWFDTFLPARERDRIRRVFHESVGGRRTRGKLNAIVTKDGREREIEWYDTELTNADGEVTGILAIGLDVTERTRLQEEFLQAQKMEAVGRLASGITHDFNNLLMGVMGCCRLALDKLSSGSEARPYVEAISDGAARGVALTRQLLDFSRKRPVEAQPISLNEVISAAEPIVRQLVDESVTLEFSLSPRVGQAVVDPGQLEQVVMNLVVNARDAMPSGGAIRIATQAVKVDGRRSRGHRHLKTGRYLLLSVEDTGPGMSDDVRSRAFEPFFTTKNPGEGTGLGLSTVHGIVSRAGGFVDIESKPGRGTRIYVYLPQHDQIAAQGRDGDRADRGREGDETILVVEDEQLVRLAVCSYLEERGYQVLSAGDPRDALDQAQHHDGTIALLISDIVLPNMSGPELARCLGDLYPGLRSLFISAYPNDFLIAQGRLEPGVETLEKPFSREALTRRVRQLLDDG